MGKGGRQGPPFLFARALELRLGVDRDVAVQYVGSLRVGIGIGRGWARRWISTRCDAIGTEIALVCRVARVLDAHADVGSLEISKEVSVGLRNGRTDVREPRIIRWSRGLVGDHEAVGLRREVARSDALRRAIGNREVEGATLHIRGAVLVVGAEPE